MKVCLVANNPHVCHIPDEYDIYVHFNWANNFALTPSKKNVMAMRFNSVAAKTKSMRWHDYCKYAKETIAIGQPVEVRKIDNEIDMIDTTKTPCPEGAEPRPSSGFAAIHYYLKAGHEVTICGFDITKAIYYGSSNHPLDWEREQIEKMVLSGVIKSI